MMDFYTNGLNFMEKIIKISFNYKGNDSEVNYDHIDDGYDQINGVLEYIADICVIPDLIVAGKPGATRKAIGKLNLSAYDVSDVRFQLETGEWVDVEDERLRNV
ncbi:hypothetical protein HMPREF0201_00719 [Cedecea davisae DSM 4568]|uniref:Uncharacterized protein n=2 Tax=Cedecea davisae TaxID=158484 RepID=S3K4X4_9ENTR|nr:hypothetical protein HMPREF0201_00719 [Cedecea davisae DSM 4568]